MYEIIEDASPYYVRFTFSGLQDIISHVTGIKEFNSLDAKNYIHKTYLPEDSNNIINMLPMSRIFSFRKHRVASFLTPPKKCSSIHKDGKADRVSFNIPLIVSDSDCITSWYSDSTFVDREIYGMPYSRTMLFDRDGYSNIQKAKTLIVRPNEALLFNTDIFHSWENNNSLNVREILTFRLDDPEGILHFDTVKKQLFEI
jgi:hypothetical protein